MGVSSFIERFGDEECGDLSLWGGSSRHLKNIEGTFAGQETFILRLFGLLQNDFTELEIHVILYILILSTHLASKLRLGEILALHMLDVRTKSARRTDLEVFWFCEELSSEFAATINNNMENLLELQVKM